MKTEMPKKKVKMVKPVQVNCIIRGRKCKIDIELAKLVEALNKVDGITTNSGYFSHGQYDIKIWFNCDSIENLNVFLWGFCFRWGCISIRQDSDWIIMIDNADTGCTSKFLRLLLIGKKKFTQKQCDKLASQIELFVSEKEEYVKQIKNNKL